MIEKVKEGQQADIAGVKAGWKIVAINGEAYSKTGLQAAAKESCIITFLCSAKATSKFGFQIGDLVATTVSCDDLPIGSKGRVVGFTGAAVEVELPQEPDSIYELGADMLAKDDVAWSFGSIGAALYGALCACLQRC